MRPDGAAPRAGVRVGDMLLKGFEWQLPQIDGEMRRDLDNANKRIEELERRLEKLERT